jgi:hypothetical protein
VPSSRDANVVALPGGGSMAMLEKNEPVRNGAARKAFQASRVSFGRHYCAVGTGISPVARARLEPGVHPESRSPGPRYRQRRNWRAGTSDERPGYGSRTLNVLKHASTCPGCQHHRCTRPAGSQRLAAIRNERRQT